MQGHLIRRPFRSNKYFVYDLSPFYTNLYLIFQYINALLSILIVDSLDIFVIQE